MSYNVHGCRGVDGYVSMQRISRVIARNNPDVVALQELDVGRTRSRGMDQVGRIARILGMKYHFHPASRWGDEQYGNAILSRYPLNLIKMESLPRAAENRLYEPRGAMWVTIDYHGTPIQVINTHLSIWPKERLLQINALLGREWLGHPDCRGPVVLCGDFNSSPGSTVYKRIIGKLQDSQSILAGHRPRRTLYGRYPLSQIDYIFVTSEFKVAAITVPRTALDQVASDHLPLSVDLNFIEDHLKPTVGTED
jgi:endonuclease/exonuclease/phosphatase family metal-dependent hydrolase